jgi:hypothetical protein
MTPREDPKPEQPIADRPDRPGRPEVNPLPGRPDQGLPGRGDRPGGPHPDQGLPEPEKPEPK